MDQQNFNPALRSDILEANSRYLNLGQVYRHQTMGENFWVDILAGMARQLLEVTSEMDENLGAEEVHVLLQNEYRFTPLLGVSAAIDKPHMIPFMEDGVLINGASCPGLPTVKSALLDIVLQEKLLTPVPYTRVPGNLSIDNMEYDIENKEVHLLGRKRLRPFGDLKHDLARFSLSLEGGFQSLKMRLDGMSGLKVIGFESNQQKMVSSMFRRWLHRLNGDLVRQVPLIVALDCFAAIHTENFAPLEQQAIIARGLYGMQSYIQNL